MSKTTKSERFRAPDSAKRQFALRLLLTFAFVFLCEASVFAQQTAPPAPPLVKRTTYKNSNVSLGAGGTVTIVGAPEGSITIEGWQKNEVEISAEIEIQAGTEADLSELAKVNGFVVDEDFNHLRIITTGTHDRDFMKRTAKKFPKRLLNMPFKIDFRVKVPIYTDLDINGGRGDFALKNVEGAMQIKILESKVVRLDLIGGTINAVFGGGNVDVFIPRSSWRGRSADIQLAAGTMNVSLTPSLNAEIQANVLRTGKIENLVPTIKPRERAKFTETSINGRSGGGGALLSFTVGDGTLKIQN